MSNPFTLQVTPELMQRLVDQGEKKPRRRRQAKDQPRPFSPISPLRQKKSIEFHESDVRHTPSVGVWPARDPYLPPFGESQPPFAGIYGDSHPDPPAADLKKELAPVYQVIEESKQLSQRLQKQGDHELAKVQEMARDLQEKQYRVPSHAPPCSNERGNCIECYKDNQKDLTLSRGKRISWHLPYDFCVVAGRRRTLCFAQNLFKHLSHVQDRLKRLLQHQYHPSILD